MKVLVLGSNGMAGHKICEVLSSSNEVKTLARKNSNYNINIEKVEDIYKIIEYINVNYFDYVINCVGVLVSDSANDPNKAILINTILPKFLKDKVKKAKIIHLSTDCIFSGEKGNYDVNNIPDATDTYGLTKIAGEIFGKNCMTIRCSIIGPEKGGGRNLFSWFKNNPNKKVNGFKNAIWSGITTLELANFIRKEIKQEKYFKKGVIQLSNNENISKLELLKLFNEIYNLKKEIEPIELKKTIDKSYVSSIDYKIPSYRKMIADMCKY